MTIGDARLSIANGNEFPSPPRLQKKKDDARDKENRGNNDRKRKRKKKGDDVVKPKKRKRKMTARERIRANNIHFRIKSNRRLQSDDGEDDILPTQQVIGKGAATNHKVDAVGDILQDDRHDKDDEDEEDEEDEGDEEDEDYEEVADDEDEEDEDYNDSDKDSSDSDLDHLNGDAWDYNSEISDTGRVTSQSRERPRRRKRYNKKYRDMIRKTWSKADKEVFMLQRQTKPILPLAPFTSLLQGITREMNDEIRWTKKAVDALLCGTEAELTDIFEKVQLAAEHAKRKTSNVEDMRLVMKMTGKDLALGYKPSLNEIN